MKIQSNPHLCGNYSPAGDLEPQFGNQVWGQPSIDRQRGGTHVFTIKSDRLLLLHSRAAVFGLEDAGGCSWSGVGLRCGPACWGLDSPWVSDLSLLIQSTLTKFTRFSDMCICVNAVS